MKLSIIVCLIIFSLLIIGCDDRNAEVPDLTVTLEDKVLFDSNGGRDITFNYKLDGSSSAISEKTILVEYPDDFGVFVSNKSTESVVTDIYGYASGIFQFDNNAIGSIQIVSKLSMDHSVKETTTLTIHTEPRIVEFYADPESIPTNSNCIIHFRLESDDNFISGLRVVLTASSGSFPSGAYATDSNGSFQATYYAPDFADAVIIKAKIEDLVNISDDTIYIDVDDF